MQKVGAVVHILVLHVRFSCCPAFCKVKSLVSVSALVYNGMGGGPSPLIEVSVGIEWVVRYYK
jgi:hypothetical protein